jgi:NAD(P)-dependent dehydrogenase (short-subunit alcohol dehydrogenase family)
MMLADKTALITGAATGIGCESAKLFAGEGAKVVIADIKEKEAEDAVTQIRDAGGQALFVYADMGKMGDSPASPSYAISKAGLVMPTRCLAYYLAKDNIRVNCICPGMVETPLWPDFISRNPEVDPEDLKQIFLQRRAIKRFGTTEEMAQAALFPASPRASYITGVALPVDGGGAAG